MKRYVLLLLFTFCFSLFTTFAQSVRMRDVFAQMPDSLLPLITKNNRLDCIDFIENNMPALVNNMLDEPIELTALTDSYLKLTMSKVSRAEMKLLPTSDSTYVICMVRTYSGPLEDSAVNFYSSNWAPLDIRVKEPSVEEYFAEVPEAESNRKQEIVAMLKDLPIRSMSLSPENEQMTFRLQTGELMKKDREWAEKNQLPVKKNIRQIALGL